MPPRWYFVNAMKCPSITSLNQHATPDCQVTRNRYGGCYVKKWIWIRQLHRAHTTTRFLYMICVEWGAVNVRLHFCLCFFFLSWRNGNHAHHHHARNKCNKVSGKLQWCKIKPKTSTRKVESESLHFFLLLQTLLLYETESVLAVNHANAWPVVNHFKLKVYFTVLLIVKVISI